MARLLNFKTKLNLHHPFWMVIYYEMWHNNNLPHGISIKILSNMLN